MSVVSNRVKRFSSFSSFLVPKVSEALWERRPALETPFPLRHPPPMRSRYTVREPERAHFITSTIVDWLPLFTTQACCDIVTGSFDFCRREKGLKLYAARPPAYLPSPIRHLGGSSWRTIFTPSCMPTISRASWPI